ncbi:hypothetical protein PRIPAC_93761, partial [Pristionchus pacificus]
TVSPNVFGEICKYLKNGSLLQMRQVSKSLDNIICDILFSRTSVLGGLTLYDEIAVFAIDNCEDLFSWTFRISHASGELKLDRSRFTMTYTYVSQKKQLVLYTTRDKLRKLLEFLKPFNNIDMVALLRFEEEINLEIVGMYADFLEGKMVLNLTIPPRLLNNKHINVLRYLLHKVQVLFIKIDFDTLTKDTLNFLFHMNNKVSGLHLRLRDISIENLTSITQKIVSCKSEKWATLCIESTATITVTDVESLLQLFHHLEDKNVEFTSKFHHDMPNIHIGSYKIIDANGYGYFSVKHLENVR